MSHPEKSLLETLHRLTDLHPERWIRTSSRTCFMFCDNKPGIIICKYLDAKNEYNLSISTINEKGDTIQDLVFSETKETSFFNDYLPFYNKVKELVIPNAINSMNRELLQQ